MAEWLVRLASSLQFGFLTLQGGFSWPRGKCIRLLASRLGL